MADKKERRDCGGVWPIDRPGRAKPFGCQWRETTWDPAANGGVGGELTARKSEWFTTTALRDARAAQLRKDRRKGALRTATRQEIEEWRAFRAATGNTPWQEVVAGWRSDLVGKGLVACNVTVEQAVEREIERAEKLESTGRMSLGTVRHKRQKLRLFGEQFGHLRINQVKGEEVETWIEDFDHVEAEGTFNNYRKQVRTMLQPYVESGMLPRNPIDVVKTRDESTDHVGILTPQQTAYLFRFAMESDRYKPAIGRFALEAFVGLRFSSGCRAAKSDINFADKGILLPKKNIKTRKRHYIDGMPAQIWEWLAITPDECWDEKILTPRRYERLKCDLFTDAKVPHPFNCFRHSFCTYDIAANKNPGRTAYLLCHGSQKLIWDRYNGHGTEADGKLYQSITPTTAAELAKGYVPPVDRALPAA